MTQKEYPSTNNEITGNPATRNNQLWYEQLTQWNRVTIESNYIFSRFVYVLITSSDCPHWHWSREHDRPTSFGERFCVSPTRSEDTLKLCLVRSPPRDFQHRSLLLKESIDLLKWHDIFFLRVGLVLLPSFASQDRPRPTMQLKQGSAQLFLFVTQTCSL